MGKIFTTCFITISLLVCTVNGAEAGQEASDGAGQRGVTLSFGYDGNYLSYEEIMNGGILDQDTGWMSGVFFLGRYDNERLLVRGLVDLNGSRDATYKGALQDGTPVTMKTSEFFFQIECSVGYKAWDFADATLTPYAALGFRGWERGEDNPPDYLETYTWGYGALGANFAYRYGKGLIGLDAAIQYPINPQMQTDMGGLVDTATFDLKSETGFHVEFPVTYELSEGKGRKWSLVARPYYQRWNIGASDPVQLKRNGIPVTDPTSGQPLYAIEPDSHTDIYGIRFGAAVNF